MSPLPSSIPGVNLLVVTLAIGAVAVPWMPPRMAWSSAQSPLDEAGTDGPARRGAAAAVPVGAARVVCEPAKTTALATAIAASRPNPRTGSGRRFMILLQLSDAGRGTPDALGVAAAAAVAKPHTVYTWLDGRAGR